jgi:hypothetical protein
MRAARAGCAAKSLSADLANYPWAELAAKGVSLLPDNSRPALWVGNLHARDINTFDYLSHAIWWAVFPPVACKLLSLLVRPE